MSIEYHIESRQSFVRLEVSGEWTPGQEAKEAKAIWQELTDTCRQTEMFRIIAVFDIPGRMPTLAAYDVASAPESFGLERTWRIAVVYPHPDRFESNLFSEDVAVNRGYTVKVFRDESSAQAWLLSRERASRSSNE